MPTTNSKPDSGCTKSVAPPTSDCAEADACVDCGRDGTLPTGPDDLPRCATCAQTYYREGRF